MPTGNTSLLGLALPVEGELDGTWGDVVNDSITSLVDSAVAGTTILSADADVTLTDTSLAANQARQAILRWTASNGATTRNITAPARSKPYIVINAGTGSVVLRGAGPTTGITIAAAESCVAAWDGSDFVKVSTNAAGAGGVTLDGVQTLTNKTLTTPVLSAVASGTVAGRLGYLSGVLSFGDGSVQRAVASLDGAQTFTNKTLTTPLLSSTASGTVAGSLGYLAGVLSFGDGSVQRAVATVDGAQTLTNKTLTTPVISSISNTGVLTLPTSTDTLVGRATTDTLTNKTMSGVVLNDGYTEEVFAVTGTTPALSPTNGSIQTWTLTASSTPTAGTWAAGQSITLMIDDGTAYTVTWSSLAVTWQTGGGSAPTLATTGYTVITLWKVGSTIYGAAVGG